MPDKDKIPLYLHVVFENGFVLATCKEKESADFLIARRQHQVTNKNKRYICLRYRIG